MSRDKAQLAGVRSLALVLAGVALLAGAAQAQPAQYFYAGKRINIVIGYETGGSYDVYARLLSRHMGKYIRGNPTFIIQNMLGAGTRLAANWLYNAAPKDGTVIGMFDQNIPLDQALGYPGVQFDVRRFSWLGNMVEINNTLVSWYTSGVTTIEQAKHKPLLMASNAGTSPALIYPLVANSFLGTKFKIITGYPNATEMNLAMERGEVEARGSNSWQSWKLLKPDWVKDKKINILFQVGFRREPDLPDVPLLTELAKNDEDRAVLEIVSAPIAFARAFVTPPDVPADRVEILRAAFEQAMQDPQLLEDARKEALQVSPMSGARVQEIVERTLSTPPATIDRLKAALEMKPGKDG